MQFTLKEALSYDETPFRVAHAPDSTLFGVTSFDQKLRVYETATLDLRKKVHLGTSFPNACAFTDSAVYAGGKALAAFDLKAFKRQGKLKHSAEIQDVAVSADFGRAVTGSGENYQGADCSLRTWDLTSHTELSRWKLGRTVFGVSIAANGGFVAGGTLEGKLVGGVPGEKKPSWTTQWREWIYTTLIRGDEVWAGGDPYGLGVFDAATGELKREITLAGATRHIAALGPDHIVLGQRKSDSKLTVIDTDGNLVWQSEVLGRMIHSVAASPDGQTLCATTSDEDRVWVFIRN